MEGDKHMERNTVTMIDQLRHGDVFYRLADRSRQKQVLVVGQYRDRRNKLTEGRYTIDENTYQWCLRNNLTMAPWLHHIRHSYQVVFLRHTVESDICETKLPNEP